jgi:PAS domain S-box-containing protein
MFCTVLAMTGLYPDDRKKTKEQLLRELAETRGQVARLERSESDRKTAEETLRATKEWVRFLLGATSSVLYTRELYPPYAFTFVSRNVKDLLGYTLDAIMENPFFWSDAIHPDDVRHVRDDLLMLESRGHRVYEYRFRHRNGRYRWILDEMNVVRDAGGEVANVFGFMIDITKRKNMEEALHQSEMKYRAIFEDSRDAIFITSRDGRFLEANRALLELFGFGAEEAGDLHVLPTYVNPAHRKEFRMAIEQQGSVRDYKLKLKKKNGEVMDCRVTASVRWGNNGSVLGYQGIIRDITEQRTLEQRILAIIDEERQQVGQDLHDNLGQHLTGIALISKALEQKLVNRKGIEISDVGKIVTSVNQAIEIARSLARGLCPVDLSSDGLIASLKEMASNVTSLYGIPCIFHCRRPVHIEDSVVAVNLYRIAQEAINNAVKHGKARHIDIGLQVRNDRVTLVVKNDGVDFPEKHERGSGMGLRIMKHRAGMIGASLNIKKSQRGGTVVSCIFDKNDDKAGKVRNGGTE